MRWHKCIYIGMIKEIIVSLEVGKNWVQYLTTNPYTKKPTSIGKQDIIMVAFLYLKRINIFGFKSKVIHNEFKRL